MPRVDREELLQSLESVTPGLSQKDELEQSSCFAFSGGKIQTYNGEVACHAKSVLNGVEGAVHAGPLLAVLRKMPEQEIEVHLGSREGGDGENHLICQGKGRELGVRMDDKIMMPLDHLEVPKRWHRLPEDFLDALRTVKECTGGKKADFIITCVHLHPKYLEACDNTQMVRYRIDTGVAAPVLIKNTAAGHVVTSGATDIAETESWVHFRSPAGVVISCRRYVEQFPSLTEHFKDMGGEAAVLPKGLIDELDRAEVFSSEEADSNHVEVTISPGRIVLSGVGVSGYYTARQKMQYSGKPLTFLAPPALLRQIVSNHPQVMITADRIKVKGGNWRYVSCLAIPETNGRG